MVENTKHTILKTENLTIGYKTKKNVISIAENINIQLEKGQLVGLVGANGIGKSTLLKTLTKNLPELNGSVLIKNTPLNQCTNLELAKLLSVVLTEPLASKNLTVFELIALGRQPYTNWVGNLTTDDLNVINKAINLINLEDLKDKKCFELSDGQLQKVMIARALAQDTDLIILDEPTTHLDMYHKAYILKLLQKLARDTQKTILFSSHEIDLAIQLCDKMIVMHNDAIHFDSPCNLIEKGVFNALFPDDLIAFDTNSGTFKVKK
ncbi:ABC transporter ATP-binding protein [Tamlana nanhaiensis]|uniref:ABC transporter ATP-binding protein n=1 Tax=Neotamlana nanhaiensis TaxID=1382798 RepID=A0A0D7W2K0_9FLAO|nr:ABC transporter ATP-binding protein [Tamlana nanhaiensis]KJD33345.1 ABC transporter ATP-binding protein [Tamlana nanhaiensis]